MTFPYICLATHVRLESKFRNDENKFDDFSSCEGETRIFKQFQIATTSYIRTPL